LADQGKTRDEIGAETGLVLGVADASLRSRKAKSSS
jgi:glycine betaine/proline transport system ATP-binding protein